MSDSQLDSNPIQPTPLRPTRVLFAAWNTGPQTQLPLLPSDSFVCQQVDAPDLLHDESSVDVLVLNLGRLAPELASSVPLLRRRCRVLFGVGGEPQAAAFSEHLDDWLPESALPLLASKLKAWRQLLSSRDLQEQWDDLQRVERMKNEFLATVHHELRTPLTSVLGSLSLLNGKVAGELPAKAGLLIDMALRNAQRLSRLIDDVLDVAKLEEERIELHRQHCEVRPLLDDALAANQSFADKVGVSLALGRCDPATIRVDADRFAQVLANLLSNAIKHSRAGDQVCVSSTSEAGWCRINVADQGPGVPPEFMSRLFEKFSQADGSDRKARGGSGLGLYISRLLVQRMEGRIGVDSTPGQGACFHVSFPLETNSRRGHD